jgi:threonine/homoserine/homoserine lactone efflux protein
VLVAAVALGVGSVVAESIAIYTTVKLAGAAYLVYLGVQAIRHRHDGTLVATREPQAPPSSWAMLRQGFVVGATNPKTIVFFVAVLPQFVDVHAALVPVQMIVLGLVFTVVALLCDASWAMAAGSARAWFARSPRRLSGVRAAGGGMMIALGAGLAVTGRKV